VSEDLDGRLFVLLADDYDLVRRSTTRLFESADDMMLTTAESGEEALALLSDRPFDLVLIDIDLGEGQMNGLELLRLILDGGHRGATAMFTAHVSVDLLHEALISGANDYLAKTQGYSLVGEARRLARIGRELPPELRPRYATIADLAFLRSIGATADQIRAMVEILDRGFPKDADLVEVMDITQQAMWQRLLRIRRKLGVVNAEQLARFLTVLEGFVRRNRIACGEAATDLAPLLAGATHYNWPSSRGRSKGDAK
jgi:DNA-binding NarL/FixJ family response regulator